VKPGEKWDSHESAYLLYSYMGVVNLLDERRTSVRFSDGTQIYLFLYGAPGGHTASWELHHQSLALSAKNRDIFTSSVCFYVVQISATLGEVEGSRDHWLFPKIINYRKGTECIIIWKFCQISLWRYFLMILRDENEKN
jgi:hypothetical protein